MKQSNKVPFYHNKIYIFMSLAMISWGVAWTNAKIVGEYLSFYNLVFFRFFLGFISLVPFVIIKKSSFIKFKQFKHIVIPSVLFLIYNIAFFKGTQLGLVGRGAILVTTLNPLITVIIISLINRRISKHEVVGIALGILGGLIIMDVFHYGFMSIFDNQNIYFLICAITWGLMTVSINYAQKIINPYLFICLCYFLTMALSMPFVNVQQIIFSELDFRFYINFFFVSIGAMSFGTSIFMYSTPILGPTKASVFIFSVPFIAALTANVFLNEMITLNIIIGGVLSLFAVYLVNKT